MFHSKPSSELGGAPFPSWKPPCGSEMARSFRAPPFGPTRVVPGSVLVHVHHCSSHPKWKMIPIGKSSTCSSSRSAVESWRFPKKLRTNIGLVFFDPSQESGDHAFFHCLGIRSNLHPFTGSGKSSKTFNKWGFPKIGVPLNHPF